MVRKSGYAWEIVGTINHKQWQNLPICKFRGCTCLELSMSFYGFKPSQTWSACHILFLFHPFPFILLGFPHAVLVTLEHNSISTLEAHSCASKGLKRINLISLTRALYSGTIAHLPLGKVSPPSLQRSFVACGDPAAQIKCCQPLPTKGCINSVDSQQAWSLHLIAVWTLPICIFPRSVSSRIESDQGKLI